MILKQLDKKTYDDYVKKHEFKSHFLQSYAWGEFSVSKKNMQAFYLGLYDHDALVGATLVLKKSLPLKYCYLYCPRGYVIDFTNYTLLQAMTKELIAFAKKNKAIFIKIDPDIIYNEVNYLNEKVEVNYNGQEIIDNLKKLKYKHLGFTKNFETMQPRYTFRIDLNQELDTIVDHFSKTTKQRIKKAEKFGCEVTIGGADDIKDFYKLMQLTENRKDFISHTEDYYQELYKIWSKDNKVTLFLGKINTKKILSMLNDEFKQLNEQLKDIQQRDSKSAKNKALELNKKIAAHSNDIDKYTDISKKYGEEILLNAHWIMEYGNKVWVLYAGNHNILSETYSNYLTYYTHIKYAKDNNFDIYDQFGTIGDLRKDNPRLGLHEFKKKFGGDYIEFIGEFDYVCNKIMYIVFTKLIPIYRNIIKKRAKKEAFNENSRG